MKKFLIIFILIDFIFSNGIVWAKIVNQYEIKKNNGFKSGFELIDKSTQRNIFPVRCNKIRKRNLNHHPIYVCQAGSSVWPETYLYSPEHLFDNFIDNYFNFNNNLNKIKFINYPKNAIIKTKDKKGNALYVSLENGILGISNDFNNSPYFKFDNSIASRIFNIIFTNKKYGSNEFLFIADVDEDISINDGVLTVTYKNISYNKFLSFNKYKNIKYTSEEQRKEIIDKINTLKKLSDIYEYISNNTSFEFEGYPLNAIIRIDNKLYIYENNKKISEIIDNYEDFYFIDMEMAINRLLTLNIFSFQTPDNIIAKKDGKWGIIDRKNNIKVPFVYEAIYSKGSNTREKIIDTQDYDATKLKIEFKGQTKDVNFFIAKQNGKYGVIDENNNILIPFETVYYIEMENSEFLIKQLKKTRNAHRLTSILYDIIMLPFAIIAAPLMLLILSSL
ncbi:hypothetical protein IJ182_02750 [bacterium]|nr:hypothetical protein [bacterium]